MAVKIVLVIFALQVAGAGTASDAPASAQVIVPAPPAPPPPPALNTPYVPRPPVPKGDRSEWVRNSDYPKSLVNGESGTTQVRLLINDKGKPIACDVTMSSGFAALDAKTCEILMKRAKFIPARSGYDLPTHGAYSVRARWTAPAPKKG